MAWNIGRSTAPLALAVSLVAQLHAHGGVYFGPGSGVPGAGGPTGPGTPTGGGGGPSTSGGSPTASGDPTSWQLWWSLHRDTFLNLRQALQQNALSTDDAYFGLGGTLARTRNGRPSIETVRDRVVPVLLAALEKERNPDVLTGASLALAKLGETRTDPDAKIRAAIERQLASSNQEVAESAAVALGILGDPASTPRLASLLRGDETARKVTGQAEIPDRTRAFAAYALGLVGARATNVDVRRYAALELCAALERDESASQDVRVACTIALGLVRVEPERLPDTSAITGPSASRENELAWLSKRLADARQTDLVRAHVPVALARIAYGGRSEVREPLVHSLLANLETHSKAPALVQQSSVIALGLLADNDGDTADRDALAALLRTTREGDALARRLAWISIGRVGARAGAAAGGDEGVQRARTALMAGLETENGLVRPWVALGLGVLEQARVRGGDTVAPDSLRALRGALESHASPAEAGAYCLALGLCRDTASRERIEREAVRTQDDELQSQAALALGLLGDRQSIEPLRRIVLDARQRPLVLRDSAIALGLLGDHELVAFLVTWLREASNLGLLSATAGALGWVGDQRAIEPLCALVESRETPDRARAFAAVALGLLCDKDLLPWNATIARDLNWWLAPATLYDPGSGTGVIDLL